MINIKSKADITDILQVTYIFQKKSFITNIAFWVFYFLLGTGLTIYSIYYLQYKFNWMLFIALTL